MFGNNFHMSNKLHSPCQVQKTNYLFKYVKKVTSTIKEYRGNEVALSEPEGFYDTPIC